MPVCVHGDVCRAWMNNTHSIAPLSPYCPVCPWFEPENNPNRPHTMIDDYEVYYDEEDDRYIIQRRH